MKDDTGVGVVTLKLPVIISWDCDEGVVKSGWTRGDLSVIETTVGRNSSTTQELAILQVFENCFVDVTFECAVDETCAVS